MLVQIQGLDENWRTKVEEKNSDVSGMQLGSIKSIVNYLLAISLNKINGSMHFLTDVDRSTDHYCNTRLLETLCFHPSVVETDRDNQELNLVFTQFYSYFYFSCYTQAKLSFQMYTDPFQWLIWLAIGISVLVSTILVDLLIKFVLKLNKSTSFFFFLGGILEETSSLGRIGEK